MVQTGAKIQLGGLKNGFFRYTYQSLIAVEVRYPEDKPAIRIIITDTKILNFLSILFRLRFCTWQEFFQYCAV
jgi:hypothetical protein